MQENDGDVLPFGGELDGSIIGGEVCVSDFVDMVDIVGVDVAEVEGDVVRGDLFALEGLDVFLGVRHVFPPALKFFVSFCSDAGNWAQLPLFRPTLEVLGCLVLADEDKGDFYVSL